MPIVPIGGAIGKKCLMPVSSDSSFSCILRTGITLRVETLLGSNNLLSFLIFRPQLIFKREAEDVNKKDKREGVRKVRRL